MGKDSFHIIDVFRVGKRTVVAAALICLVAAAVSCRTIRTIEVPVPIHDTTYVTKTERDSVFVEHSTTYYVKGDTVFNTKVVTKYVERLKTDTISVYVEKPIEIVKTEERLVEKPLKWWQKTLMYTGVFFIVGFIFFLALLIIKSRM